MKLAKIIRKDETVKCPFHTGKMLTNSVATEKIKISNKISILATKFHFGKDTVQIKPTQILPPDGISHDPNILIHFASTY